MLRACEGGKGRCGTDVGGMASGTLARGCTRSTRQHTVRRLHWRVSCNLATWPAHPLAHAPLAPELRSPATSMDTRVLPIFWPCLAIALCVSAADRNCTYAWFPARGLRLQCTSSSTLKTGSRGWG